MFLSLRNRRDVGSFFPENFVRRIKNYYNSYNALFFIDLRSLLIIEIS